VDLPIPLPLNKGVAPLGLNQQLMLHEIYQMDHQIELIQPIPLNQSKNPQSVNEKKGK